MIDSTKSPTPIWKKYTASVLLAVLIVVAGYMIWTKELHHSSSNPSSSAPQITAPVKQPAAKAKSPSTTIPGGVPVSSRNPFGS